MGRHKKYVPEIAPIKNEIDGVAGSQIAKIIPKTADDLQQAVEKHYAPDPVKTENERVTFYAIGTSLPLISGRRHTVKGTQENGYRFSTDCKELIEWLDANGFKRKE